MFVRMSSVRLNTFNNPAPQAHNAEKFLSKKLIWHFGLLNQQIECYIKILLHKLLLISSFICLIMHKFLKVEGKKMGILIFGRHFKIMAIVVNQCSAMNCEQPVHPSQRAHEPFTVVIR